MKLEEFNLGEWEAKFKSIQESIKSRATEVIKVTEPVDDRQRLLFDSWYSRSKVRQALESLPYWEPTMRDTYIEGDDDVWDDNFNVRQHAYKYDEPVSYMERKAMVEYVKAHKDTFLSGYVGARLWSHVSESITINYKDGLPFDKARYSNMPKVSIKQPFASVEDYVLINGSIMMSSFDDRETIEFFHYDSLGIEEALRQYHEWATSLGELYDWTKKGHLHLYLGYHGQCNFEMDDEAIGLMAKLNLGFCFSCWES